MRRVKAIAPAALVLTLLATSCRRAEEQSTPAELETETVGAAVDAAVTTQYDVQARSSEEIVGSRMPSDFPSDVPLFRSGSLINYGPVDSGRSFIELSVPAERSVVERRYAAQIEGAGWRRGEAGVFSRQGRTIVVSFRDGAPGTWVRIEYGG